MKSYLKEHSYFYGPDAFSQDAHEKKLLGKCSEKLQQLGFLVVSPGKGAFTNYVDKFLAFFDHLSPSIDIFYLINLDKKSRFLDYLSLGLPSYPLLLST